ncbi:MAG TPA: tripartite tricarboxylate transporter substrate binding protein [Xanthobacteraceae bacterium]|nr:tripartite tricarboxylate transporter substrate binding protein [Xanthobacteraceae bacterium]
MLSVLRAVLCCAIALLAGQAGAQTSAPNWPSRPIKLIVPTGPGAATDVMARLVADDVSRTIGQAMFVENMPGASGILAHETVARAAPDGYTLLFTNTSGMAINLISFKQLPYDPTRDFTAVAMVCDPGTQMLSVNADLPVKSVDDLIAYAKANPGKLSIAFDNTAGAAAFAAKLFNKRAGLGLVEVPYRSSGQMTQDVAAGVNQVLMSSIAAAASVVQAGKVRQLAVTSENRFPGLPDLPALQEKVPGVVMNGFFAIVAPAGTPANIIAPLNRAIGHYLQGADVKQRLMGLGLVAGDGGSAESAAQTIRQEQEQWRAFGKELNVEPQ